MDPYSCTQEERALNVKPATMTNTQQIQLVASHHIITEGIVATIEQSTNTESEKDSPLFRRKMQKVLGVRFIAAP